MSDIHDAWKPLRNYLRKLDVNDSLSVIRYYSARRSGPTTPPLPSDIQPHPWIDKESAFLPWELESLAREVVISSGVVQNPQYTFRKADDLAKAINKMKELENLIEEQSIDQENIRHEVSVRLSHRQFKYQTERPSIANMVRYSKIFGHELVAPILEAKTGLKPKQLFTIGAGLWSHYTKTYGMHYPLETLSLTGITEDDYAKFVNLYSKPLAEMKVLLTNASERKLDDAFFYQYHSLFAFPLILTELNDKPAHVCPIPTLLYWRVTSGLYYDLYKEAGFDNAFGTAFEEYVGAVLIKTLENTNAEVHPGEKNSKLSPNRCDWVIEKPNECLVIECKTKRLTMGAKTNLADTEELTKQLDILGDAVKQAYLSLQAYRNNAYKNPVYEMSKSTQAYVCVTTLEKWYLLGPQINMLHDIVKKKIVEAGLDEAILTESPYIVLPVDDMERVSYLAKTHSISEIVKPYVSDSQYDGWEFNSYMNKVFKKELGDYEYVFDDDIQDAYTVPLDMSKRGSRKQKDDIKR